MAWRIFSAAAAIRLITGAISGSNRYSHVILAENGNRLLKPLCGLFNIRFSAPDFRGKELEPYRFGPCAKDYLKKEAEYRGLLNGILGKALDA